MRSARTSCLISMSAILGMGPHVSIAADVSLEDVLAAMKVVEDGLQSFRCEMTVTSQQHVRHDRDEQGRSHAVELEPDARPEPITRKHEILVSGDRFVRRDHDLSRNPPQINRRAWDGQTLLVWTEGHPEASKRSSVSYWYGAKIEDPRDFVFRGNPERSLRLDVLNDENAVVKPDRLDGRDVVLVEAGYTPDDADHIRFSHRIWLDPEKRFVPTKIETFINGKLVLRWHEIVHKEVVPGIWFPVAGTLDNFGHSRRPLPDRISTRMRMTVDPVSIVIAPPIAEDTFSLNLSALQE